MKKIIFALALFAAAYGQSQAQTFNPEESKTLQIEVGENVAIAPIQLSKSSFMTIVVEIDNEMSAETFQRIKRTNRYEVKGKKEGKNYVISMPNLEKKMKVNGEEVRENITLKIIANTDYKISQKNSTVLLKQDKKATFNSDIVVELRLAESSAAMGMGAPKEDADIEMKKAAPANKATIKPSGKHGDILIDDVPIDPF